MDITDKFFVIAKLGHSGTLWLLVLLSIVSIGFILERIFTLRGVIAKSEAVTKMLQETLQSNSIKEFDTITPDRDSFVGRAVAYGLRHTKEHGSKGLEEVFNAYSLNERPELEKHLNFLATVGSNAPFIGLLGTVFGIMEAFQALATSQGDMTAVMLGISQALVATAIGLMVAIPAVIAYNYFQKRVKRIMQSLESAKDVCLAYAKILKGV
jgi:biopolymer transport protein TolQ